MATDTRQRLIEAAKSRFYRDGFRNVGIDAILDDVGISKTAFYKHFASKDDLMVGVLDDVNDFLQQRFRRMVKDRGGPAASSQLRAVLDIVKEIIEDQSFHGCIFVNVAMEFPSPHDPALQAAVRHKKAIEEFVYELAERAGSTRPSDLARELCMIMEGAYVTRAVTRDAATIDIARRLAESAFERHLPVRHPTPP